MPYKQSEKYLIVVVGPTGIGKTSVAIQIAKHLNTEIISCDSRQLFKEMTIGTAVPAKEELSEVPHHLIQNHSVEEYYNASMYEQEVLQILDKLYVKYDTVVMVGGTGLYIDAVCNGIDELPDFDKELRAELTLEFETEGIESLRRRLKMLDPIYYEKVDLNNSKRLIKAIEMSIITGKPYSSLLTQPKKERPFKVVKVGLKMDRDKLYERINLRVDRMIKNGLIEEARQLYPRRGLNALNTVGYRELFDAFEGLHSIDEALELIKRNSRRYARRQITWFNRYIDIKWFDVDSTAEILTFVKDIHGI